MCQDLKDKFNSELVQLNSNSYILQLELDKLEARRKEVLMGIAVLQELEKPRDSDNA